jgi:GDP-4-dehydro-6-deoxy-D-mannose reductase
MAGATVMPPGVPSPLKPGKSPGYTTLITGAAGMIGSHLFQTLIGRGEEVIGAYYRPTVALEEIAADGELVELDVRYFEPLRRLFEERRPERIFHLAAQSLPTASWQRPWETFDVNVTGTVNLFEAIKAVRASDSSYDPVVVVACSSAEYGASIKPENVPIAEDTPMLPLHPYGVSKVAQDLLAFQYWKSDEIRGIRGRIFNTTGPRKRDDVVSDFACRVARIRREGGRLRVGNIDTQRAILDVRDTVEALIRLAAAGASGEAYNICADTVYPVSEFIRILEKLTNQVFDLALDPTLFRPTDEPVIFGDSSKLKAHTGWRQNVTIDETIKAVLEYEQTKYDMLSEPPRRVAIRE